MDVGRRHETPGSETKDFITHSDSSSQHISIRAISASPSFHKVMWISPRDTCTHTEWNPEFKDLKSLVGSKLIFPLSQREVWTCSQWAIAKQWLAPEGDRLCLTRLFSMHTSLVGWSRIKAMGGFACKIPEMRDPWRIVSRVGVIVIFFFFYQPLSSKFHSKNCKQNVNKKIQVWNSR